MSLQIARNVLSSALRDLSASALDEIAQHCESNVSLARSMAAQGGFSASKALLDEPLFDAMRRLGEAAKALRQMK